MKTCIKCKETKEFSEFHRRPKGSLNAYRNQCKKCRKLSVTPETIERKKLYQKSEAYKKVKKKYRESVKGRKKANEYSKYRYYNIPGVKEGIAKARIKHKKSAKGKASAARLRALPHNKEKRKVYNLLHSALENGLLRQQNCQVCGSEKSQAHHEDYSKPLDVIWFCSEHHNERHRVMKHG